MLPREAEWLGRNIHALPAGDVFPLLNLGSCTATFRRVSQPYIYRRIEQPAERRRARIVHVDLEPGDGVDLALDLLAPASLETLRTEGCRSVLCANLLEHVEDVSAAVRRITELVPSGGYAFVSVPRRFKHHPHPIDNGLRPTVAELEALFPDLELVTAETVDCGRYFGYSGGWRRLARTTLRLGLPFLRPHELPAVRRRWRELIEPISTTCAVFRRP